MAVPIGNYLCAASILLETLFVNGIYNGWGMMTTIFKNKNMYNNTCIPDPMNASLTNCEIRDKQFNDIYFLSNISYNICVCLAGFIGVQFGNVIVRITSFALCLVGLVLTSFVETNEDVIWIAWPCLAVGGIVSHMVNMPLCRSIPHLSMTLMSIAAGCFGAGGSVPYVMKIIVDNTELELFQIFMIWTIIYIIVSLPKILLWTPNRIPLIMEEGYSVYQNTFLRACGTSSHYEKRSKEASKFPKLFKVLSGPNFYLVLLAYGVFVLRIQTFIAWLSSGWPEWIANTDDEQYAMEFNEKINTLNSYITFGLIILNAIPGLVIDFCRKKWNNEPKGAAIGISICFTLSFIFVCAGSILSGFQNETIAYVSIIVQTIGKAWGIVFSATWMFLFPPDLYGILFGIYTLSSLPFVYINQPMYNYSIRNDDFSIMNFLQAALSVFYLLIPLACYLLVKSTQNQKINDVEMTRKKSTRL